MRLRAQAGRDAVEWARACLRDQAEARALADKAVAAQRALEADALAVRDRLREEVRRRSGPDSARLICRHIA